MKKIILTTAVILSTFAAFAQDQTNQVESASQTTNLALSNAIEITFVSNGSATGEDVTMQFETPNDFANGKVSPEQRLKVRSNLGFKVSVKYDLSTFSYKGKGNIGTIKVAEDAFGIMVTENKTGGSVKAPYSMKDFAPLYGSNRELLINGKRGGNQAFGVKYKFVPGFYMHAGTYAIDVVYTATQE